MKRQIITACALAALLLTASAFGKAPREPRSPKAKWTPIYPAVALSTWKVDEPLQVVYAARVNLQAKGVELKTTPPNKDFAPETRETRRQTTDKFLTENKLTLAVKANFYSPFNADTIKSEGDSNLCGLAASDGFVESNPEEGFPSFIKKKDGTLEIRQVAPEEDLSEIEQAVSGNMIVLRDGEVVAQTDKATHPRTGIGYSKDRRYLYFVVIDGRQKGYSIGATYEDVGRALARCGAWDGLNLDGGGSTTMVVKGAKNEPIVVNRPNNGTSDKLRNNGNAIGVSARGKLRTRVPDGRYLRDNTVE